MEVTEVYKPNKVMIIDGLNNFIRSFNSVGVTNDQGEFVGGMFGTLNTLKYLAQTFNPNIIVWCWEGRNSGKKRREVFSEYKAGRKTRKSLTRVYEFSSPEAEKESFKKQILRLKDYFSILPIYQMEIENLEADDVIAYVANNLFMKDRKIIVSTDKDYWQLINDNVLVYRPITKQIMNKEAVAKETGVYPVNHALYKSVIGDASDGIPQLKKGFGSKTFVKLFPFLKENNIYTIQDVIKYAQEHANENEKYSLFLTNESKLLLERNYTITQLKNYEISSPSVDKIRETFITQKPVLSISQLMISFLKDNLHSQVKKYDDYYKIFLPISLHNKKLVNIESIL